MKTKKKIKLLEQKVALLQSLLIESWVNDLFTEPFKEGKQKEIVSDEQNKNHLSKSKSKFQQRLDEVMEQQKQAKEQ